MAKQKRIFCVRPLPGKTVSDDFIHAVLSNCATRIVLPAPNKFGSESLPDNFNIAAVGVMKKGMSMRLFSSPGHIVVAGQSGGGKSVLLNWGGKSMRR
ncbi:DUF2689 domain-containing protein [Escherichia coli]